MKKISVQIAVTALVLLVFCLIYRIAVGDTIVTAMPNPGFEDTGGWVNPPDTLILDMTNEEVIKMDSIRVRGQIFEMRFVALAQGQSYISFKKQGDADPFRNGYYVVNRFHTIWESQMMFTGEEGIVFAAGLFLLMTGIYFLVYFLGLKGVAIYSYQAIFAIGMTLLTGAGAIGVFSAFVRSKLDPVGFGIYAALQSISKISGACMMYLTIPMLVFAIAMIISNVELLRHERLRFANVLGILIPIAMILGELILFILEGMYFMGSFEEYRIREVIFSVLDTMYVYFECMLAGSVICGIRAVKHKVALDKDYIIILGCKFRNDGSLTPLLQGRCDRAIGFWKQQKAESGKEAVLIPSGGQGSDESMPEAEAMARYLLTQGIPESAIIRETQSKNTYQNMEFSKKIIDEADPNARVVFSTTNYHVFRSGLWASLAGLDAEGIGGVTKWWFWPNAFMRECVGLMANRVKQEALLFVIVIILSIALSYLTIR